MMSNEVFKIQLKQGKTVYELALPEIYDEDMPSLKVNLKSASFDVEYVSSNNTATLRNVDQA